MKYNILYAFMAFDSINCMCYHRGIKLRKRGILMNHWYDNTISQGILKEKYIIKEKRLLRNLWTG